MACVELCGSIHTVLRQTSSQTPIGLGTHFIGIGVSDLLTLRDKSLTEKIF